MKSLGKKIISVVSGISLLGATMLGAMAANYPDPFVKDGSFSGFIVVGQAAQPADVVGAVDIGASLQYEMRTAVNIAGSREASVTEGKQIEKSGNAFNYGDSMYSVMGGTALTEDDLPSILADGTYNENEGNTDNDITYTQRLRFIDGQVKLNYYQDDDDAPTAGPYLAIDDSNLYNYSLTFDDPLSYDNSSSSEAIEDIETSTIKIQGQYYTITEVEVDSKFNPDKLTMLSGETILWLTQDAPITKSVNGVDHKIAVVDVTEHEDSCVVKVDDTQAVMDIGDTKKINGVDLGVIDAKAVHAQLQDQDICQLSVGTNKLTLENEREIVKDGDELDGSEAYINALGGEIDSINVVYAPEDEAYLGTGKAWIDPVFNNWKIVFAGMEEDYEKLTAKTSGSDNGEIVFTNNDGKDVKVPIYKNDTGVMLGKDDDELLLRSGTSQDRCTVSNLDDCKDNMLWVVNNGEAHVLRIDDVDVSDNKISISDITYGREYTDRSYTPNATTSIDVGQAGTIQLYVDTANKSIVYVSGSSGDAETEVGAHIQLNADGFKFIEQDDDEAPLDTATIQFYNTSDEEIKVKTSVDFANGTRYNLEDDSDIEIQMSKKGTKITEDIENNDEITIEYGAEDAKGDVFITPITASVTEPLGSSIGYDIQRINVGMSRLDTEIGDASAQDMIIVGGPAVNKMAAQVMGKTYPTYGTASGVPENAAMIKMYAQSTGKIAIVVAGWNAAQTRDATNALANFREKNMSIASGTEYRVSGTTVTKIA